jgi:hypothetical protein
MEPIINAPNGAENPTVVASTTIPRHRAMARINKVSSLSHCETLFNKVGRTVNTCYKPETQEKIPALK